MPGNNPAQLHIVCTVARTQSAQFALAVQKFADSGDLTGDEAKDLRTLLDAAQVLLKDETLSDLRIATSILERVHAAVAPFLHSKPAP